MPRGLVLDAVAELRYSNYGASGGFIMP